MITTALVGSIHGTLWMEGAAFKPIQRTKPHGTSVSAWLKSLLRSDDDFQPRTKYFGRDTFVCWEWDERFGRRTVNHITRIWLDECPCARELLT